MLVLKLQKLILAKVCLRTDNLFLHYGKNKHVEVFIVFYKDREEINFSGFKKLLNDPGINKVNVKLVIRGRVEMLITLF